MSDAVGGATRAGNFMSGMTLWGFRALRWSRPFRGPRRRSGRRTREARAAGPVNCADSRLNLW